MANKSVVLYQNVKFKNEWKLQEVVDELPKFSPSPLYVSWYEGTRKRMEPRVLTLVTVLSRCHSLHVILKIVSVTRNGPTVPRGSEQLADSDKVLRALEFLPFHRSYRQSPWAL